MIVLEAGELWDASSYTTDPLDALPTDPNNGGPWVMWKGTKYAHIMVPVKEMPKKAAAKPAK